MDPWNGKKAHTLWGIPTLCLIFHFFSPWWHSWCQQSDGLVQDAADAELFCPVCFLSVAWESSEHPWLYTTGMSFLKRSRKTCRTGDSFPFQSHAGICQSAVTCLECFPVFWQITRFAALIPLGLAGLVSCLKADFFFSGSWFTFLVWSLAMHRCWSLRSHECSAGRAPSGAWDFGERLKEVDLLGACLGWICTSPKRLTSFPTSVLDPHAMNISSPYLFSLLDCSSVTKLLGKLILVVLFVVKFPNQLVQLVITLLYFFV